MKETITYGLWALLYAVCAGLGFAGTQEGAAAVLFTLLSLLFFVPGILLLYWGNREGKRGHILAVRIISIVSLSATLITLVANFGSVLLSETAGNVLYGILVVVSAPMVCSQYWVLSLFLWACLLMGSFLKGKK